ncbi:IS1 family transposase [Hymenobacter lapidiphilus]|uniref:IS1 family transposase n=1 Tax=Hymenobacter sp. CCM 8763 TaxID=2303334 RepID=UPI003977827E
MWAALPRRYQRHCRYHTDQWEAYAKVLPVHQHRPHPKGSGKTNSVEAINCSLRQCCDVLVRKSCSFSKTLRMHTARIKIVIDDYNITL